MEEPNAPKKVIKRTESGQFPAGTSGNPAGRPKGRRNEITLLKESLELALREQGADRIPEVLETAIELALEGDRQMIKLLLDYHISKGLGDMKAGQEKVTINIKGPDETKPAIIDITPDSSQDDVQDEPREGILAADAADGAH